MAKLRAPFPWFGGKSRVSDLVWTRFGNVQNYVEPFAGSMAVLLGRPTKPGVETVNDLDAYVPNFWRAVKADPEQVAYYADWPVSEADLHARHLWLIRQDDFREQMLTDPDYYDLKIAGWWVWGLSAWIGKDWCKKPSQSRPNLQTSQGIQKYRNLPHLSGNMGVHRRRYNIAQHLEELQKRLRLVRVACGDWSRILGPTPTYKIGSTGIFFDPPYDPKMRHPGLYSQDDNEETAPISQQVREWCKEEIQDKNYSGPRYLHPKLKIALCGYVGEHDELEQVGWEVIAWKANGGYSNQNKKANPNKSKERIWFSPNCLNPKEITAIRDEQDYSNIWGDYASIS